MPMFMDIHEMRGITADDLAKAHAADMKIQAQFGVEYHKYWFNEATGKVYCLCSAPNAEAAVSVHRQSHGAVAQRLIEVTEDIADAFLGDTGINDAGAATLPGTRNIEGDPGIRSVMFTDIVGSTDMTQRLGDEAAMELLHIHDRIVRAALAAQAGREIKHTGDGIMASFFSAAAAIRCGVQVQRELRGHSASNPAQTVQVRIGVAAGEPVEHHNDLFGSTVQLSARLCAHAQPEQILVSNVVAELCLGKGVAFTDLGGLSLKGFSQPVRAHAVSW
jgi:class 3 adenylate cyclase